MGKKSIQLKEILLILSIGVSMCFCISSIMKIEMDEAMIIYFSIFIGAYICSQKNYLKKKKIVVITVVMVLGEFYLWLQQKPANIMFLFFFIWLGSLFFSVLFTNDNKET